MDALDRMFQRLVYVIRNNYPEYLSRPFEVAEVYQTLIPYRHNRRELGLETNQEYELVLMDLLSGARGYVRGDARMQESLRQELASSNPDPTRFRVFSGAEVSISPTALEEGASRGGGAAVRGEHPARDDRKARDEMKTETPAMAALEHDSPRRPVELAIEREPGAVAAEWEAPRAKPQRPAPAPAESRRAEPPRVDPVRTDSPRGEPLRAEQARAHTGEEAQRTERPRQAARVAPDAQRTDPLAVSRARASRLAAARAAVAPGGSGAGGNSAASARSAPASNDSENEMANQPRAMSANALGGSCRYCSGNLPDGRKIVFCPHCGQNLTVQHCPACGTELELGWKFCTTCGRGVASS